jgi:hypothetical protein
LLRRKSGSSSYGHLQFNNKEKHVGIRVMRITGGDELFDEPEAGIVPMPSSSEEGATIYLRHLQLAVSTVMRERADLRDLFSATEQALAAAFLIEEDNHLRAGPADVERARGPALSREARGLYTRMLQRKGPWFRLDSLIKYDELLSEWKEGGPHGVALRERWQRAQRALAELEACSLVSCISTLPQGARRSSVPENFAAHNKYGKNEVLEAISACLRMDEIKILLARVAKCSAAALNRREALARLEQACVGQRTLTDFFKKGGGGGASGSNIHERLLQELATVLCPSFADSPLLISGAHRDAGGGAAGVVFDGGKRGGGGGGEGGAEVLMVKIQEDGKYLFRRMLRLLYMGECLISDTEDG